MPESVEDILLRKIGSFRVTLELEQRKVGQLTRRVKKLEKNVSQLTLDVELLRNGGEQDREAFLRGEDEPLKT